MTGPWQILGSTRVPLEEMVKIDYLYGANWSLWADVKILLRTVIYVLGARSADGERPILVTGIPRSGTSWVGKMLDAGGEVVYINEPLSDHRPPGRSPGVLAAPDHHRFQYISEANEPPT